MTQTEVQRLVDELARRFNAQVEPEEIAPGRYRFDVVSSRFTGMAPLHRQDEVWAVVDQILTRDQTLDVSLILTFDPTEIEIVPKA